MTGRTFTDPERGTLEETLLIMQEIGRVAIARKRDEPTSEVRLVAPRCPIATPRRTPAGRNPFICRAQL